MWRSGRSLKTPADRERAAVTVLDDGKPELISTQDRKIATFASHL
jgi:hypothetical protein